MDIAEHADLDEFLDAYIEAALWSTMDYSDESGGDPMDANYDASDIHPDTLAQMRHECNAFLHPKLGGRPLAIAERMRERGRWCNPGNCSVVAYAGHDFWLTRNGHGCGFWDGDWPSKVGDRLNTVAKKFREVDLYVGDDGKIHA